MSNDQPPFDEATAGHLSMDEIADLGEGLLSDEQATAARAHLAGCVECVDRVAALDAATTALHNLGPVAMPTDVAARIDAALAAEGSTTAGSPDTATASNVTVMPDPSAIPRQRFRLPTAPSAAAAAVIVLAAVAIVVGHQHHHHNGITVEQAGRAQAPLVGSAGNAATVTPVSTGRVYDTSNIASYVPALLTSQIPALAPTGTGSPIAGLGNSTDGASGGVSTGSGAATGGSAAGSSATTHSPKHSASTSRKHQKATKNSTHGTVPAPATAPGTTTSLNYNSSVPTVLAHLYSDRAALLDCAATASDTVGAVPLAVDFGRWKSPTAKKSAKPVPAVIFVFEDVNDTSTVDVYVVASSGCGSILHVDLGIPK